MVALSCYMTASCIAPTSFGRLGSRCGLYRHDHVMTIGRKMSTRKWRQGCPGRRSFLLVELSTVRTVLKLVIRPGAIVFVLLDDRAGEVVSTSCARIHDSYDCVGQLDFLPGTMG